MSRRRGLRDERTAVYCGLCAAEVADGVTLCGRCVEHLTDDLIELADWLAEEIETTIAGQSGVRFGGTGGAGGSDLSPNYEAIELDRRLHEWLIFAASRLRHHDMARGMLSARMADWLAGRVKLLDHDDQAPTIASAFADLVRRGKRLVDLPPDRQFLGECPACGVGRLYGAPDSDIAKCDTCREKTDAIGRRAELLKRLDDQFVTAAEFARLSTYLGLPGFDRERVRKRVNQWQRRGRITVQPSLNGAIVFRFGDLMGRLREDAERAIDA